MNSVIKFWAPVLIAIFLCQGCLKHSGYKGIMVILPNNDKQFDAYFVIPGAGCNGCITNAENLMRQNVHRKNIRFVLTNIESLKELKLKMGEHRLDNQNVYIDTDNQIFSLFNPEEFLYPVVIYLNGNRINKVDQFEPQSPENYDTFIKFLESVPEFTMDIKSYIENPPMPIEPNWVDDFLKIEKIHLEQPFGNIMDVVIDFKTTNKYFFMLDAKQRLYIYEKNGKLFGVIDKKGRGPGEYSNAVSFDLDTALSRVLVLDINSKNIQAYNFEGEFLKTIKLPVPPLSFLYLHPDKLLLFVPDYHQFNTEKYELYIVHENGEILSKHKPYPEIDRPSKPDLFNTPLMVKKNNDIVYWVTNTDIVFKINPIDFSLSKYFHFYQGNLKVSPEISENLELFNENLGRYIFQLNAIVAGKFVFIKFFYNMEYYGFVTNTGLGHTYLASKGQFQPFMNSMDYGNFWPAFHYGEKSATVIYEDTGCHLLIVSEK